MIDKDLIEAKFDIIETIRLFNFLKKMLCKDLEIS